MNSAADITHAGAGHGIQERLHGDLIAVGRCLALDVLHRNHLAGIQLLHQLGCLRGIKDLGASTNANDQHIRLTQQHAVRRADWPGGGTHMGEVEPALFPPPDGGVAEAPALKPVVGAGEPFKAETIQPVGAGIHQKSSTGDVPSPFIGQFGAGEDHAGLHPWLRQTSGTAHGPVGVQQHGLTSALNQQSALAVAADGHASACVGGALQSNHQSEGGECGGAQDGHRQLSDGPGR